MAIPKMIPNPAYLESPAFARRKEAFRDALTAAGELVEDFFPEEYDKQLPETGGWIMLLTEIRVGKTVREGTTKHINVPHMSMWYAMPTLTTCFRELEKVKMHMSQAVIHTPDGDVHVWPHEYTRVDIAKYLDFGEADGIHIRFLNPQADGFNVDKLFYLRSRGLGEAAAKRLLLPELATPDYCYFEFDSSITSVFGDGCGMAVPLRRRS